MPWPADHMKFSCFASALERLFCTAHIIPKRIAGAFGVGNRDAAVSGLIMSRISVFSSPLLLGFDQLEQLLDQATKSGDGYPPYNIERLTHPTSGIEEWQITLAVAGFAADDLDVTVEGKQLMIRGKTREDAKRDYLHRGIAGRSFARQFVLADGMEVTGASLENGLLTLLLNRMPPERLVKRILVKER
jgi:HSP20 family molecular chaperone IbpA